MRTVALLVLLCGCQKLILDTGPESEGDADADTDADGDTDADADGDTDGDTDTDTGTIQRDPPVITGADAYCYEHTTGDTFFQWEANCQVTDPQGNDTIAPFDTVNNRMVVLLGATEVADYALTCNTSGGCYGSFREGDDGVSCAQATSYLVRFTVADEDGLVSAPYEVYGRQR